MRTARVAEMACTRSQAPLARRRSQDRAGADPGHRARAAGPRYHERRRAGCVRTCGMGKSPGRRAGEGWDSVERTCLGRGGCGCDMDSASHSHSRSHSQGSQGFQRSELGARGGGCRVSGLARRCGLHIDEPGRRGAGAQVRRADGGRARNHWRRTARASVFSLNHPSPTRTPPDLGLEIATPSRPSLRARPAAPGHAGGSAPVRTVRGRGHAFRQRRHSLLQCAGGSPRSAWARRRGTAGQAQGWVWGDPRESAARGTEFVLSRVPVVSTAGMGSGIAMSRGDGLPGRRRGCLRHSGRGDAGGNARRMAQGRGQPGGHFAGWADTAEDTGGRAARSWLRKI
ncbi:hypothetical protein CERSUDRAFT_112380 [Gelatoporia subvermispora B]|uniref:Uncharacterized protein n=1 Tax=Ceriporiopsis subvermispora (strain B) TaxID=914234 RepID=M2RMT4_CERS8|nr:hypothetical protein CERSUDRAFT_112380 [Gelatoporia subvermispora B]